MLQNIYVPFLVVVIAGEGCLKLEAKVQTVAAQVDKPKGELVGLDVVQDILTTLADEALLLIESQLSIIGIKLLGIEVKDKDLLLFDALVSGSSFSDLKRSDLHL